MPTHFTATAANIQFSPLAQHIGFLILTIAITSLILWAYHKTHFSHSDTSKGIHSSLKSIKETLLDISKKN
jgi:hypothetical protein